MGGMLPVATGSLHWNGGSFDLSMLDADSYTMSVGPPNLLMARAFFLFFLFFELFAGELASFLHKPSVLG